MGAVSRLEVSPYDALERLFVAEPYGSARDDTAVPVICHHAGGITEFAMWEQPGHLHVMKVFAENRPLVSPLGRALENWGNDLAITKTDEAIDYAVDYLGAERGRVVIVGTSMGLVTGLNWVRQNLDRTVLVVGLIGLIDLGGIHASNSPVGATASIDTAYGGAYVEATHGPTHNPANYAAELAGVPIRLFYSGTDALVLPETVLDFAETVGESARVHDIGGPGHDVEGLAGVSQPWLRRLLAAWA